MTVETAIIKPAVDLVLGTLKKITGVKLKRDARKALSEAIQELITIDPNLTRVEVKIRKAKAAGEISIELLKAEEMLEKVRLALGPEIRKLSTAREALQPVSLPGKKKPAKKAPIKQVNIQLAQTKLKSKAAANKRPTKLPSRPTSIRATRSSGA